MKLLLLDRVRYPDGQVVCGPMGGGVTFMTAPVILFEVVSPGSAVLDHGDKVAEYRAVASVEAYVILEQDRAAATVHSRDDRGWRVARLTAGDALVLPVLGLSVPMIELYEGIDLPRADQAGSGTPSGK